MRKILLNTRVLAKLNNYDKPFVESYLFAKSLAQFTAHPVLYCFKANSEAYRLLLGIGKHKYQRLLKSAITQGFAKYHGDNLHLISHTQERRLFCVKSNHQTEINPSEIKHFAQAQILIKNIKSQKRALAKKLGSSFVLSRSPGDVLNQRPVLSCRKVGQLLNISHTLANNLLTKLQCFGLTAKNNAVQITKEQYLSLKASNSYNIRYNGGQYLFIGAKAIDYKKPPVFKSSGYSYCSNDI